MDAHRPRAAAAVPVHRAPSPPTCASADPEATDDELWDALEIAQAADFVEEMPERLNAPIAQGGTNVSGGQRQRLAIARAIVKRPAISCSTTRSRRSTSRPTPRLRAALARQPPTRRRHRRPARLDDPDADRIVVLEDGRVVGTGTHEELMETCQTYREIVESQLGRRRHERPRTTGRRQPAQARLADAGRRAPTDWRRRSAAPGKPAEKATASALDRALRG